MVSDPIWKSLRLIGETWQNFIEVLKTISETIKITKTAEEELKTFETITITNGFISLPYLADENTFCNNELYVKACQTLINSITTYNETELSKSGWIITEFKVSPFGESKNLIEFKLQFHDHANISIFLSILVEVLHNSCFESLEHLAELRFESGSKLRMICRSALSGCDSLRNIAVPVSVSEIEESAFKACIGLEDCCIHRGAMLARRHLRVVVLSDHSMFRSLLRESERTVSNNVLLYLE
jgi:hypothetical protein